jgi:hypothetical protein
MGKDYFRSVFKLVLSAWCLVISAWCLVLSAWNFRADSNKLISFNAITQTFEFAIKTMFDFSLFGLRIPIDVSSAGLQPVNSGRI